MKKLLSLLLLCLISIHAKPAHAEDAQDAYDPFIDYNEYEAEDEEEADVNFFQHGRFVTAGFLLGDQFFTQGSADVYKPAVAYGIYLSYFFDMRFALQFGYLTSSHTLSVTGPATGRVTGTSKFSAISIDLKYYVNTQNISKGLAFFNPYFIGGFSSITRQTTVDGEPEFTNETAMAPDIGVGVEIPMMHNKMYIGAQGLYQLTNFKDKNTPIMLGTLGNDPTGKTANGDMVTVLGIIGINF